MRLPVVLVCISYLILIATDFLIVSDLRRMSVFRPTAPAEKKPGVWWKVFLVFAVLVLALLTVAVCLPKRSLSMAVTPAMWLVYVVTTVAIAQIIYCIFSLLGFIPVLFRSRRLNIGLWVGLPLAVGVFSMMWWGMAVGRYKLLTNEVTISSPRLPKTFEGYRIAQISDLHVGTWGNDTVFLSNLVSEVNALSPDLIVFTGDLVNREAGELKPFIPVLSKLHAPDGVLTVLGNHDYGDYVSWASEREKAANLDSLKVYEARMGWRMLDNDHLSIFRGRNDSIVVIGVGNWGEPPFSRYGDLRKAYSAHRLNDGNFKLLLSHNPEHWNREVSRVSNIDLTLAGHTHAMQIMFSLGGWRWSPSQYKYSQWAGLYSRRNPEGVPTEVYVNTGAGEVGMPMRIGADPEITLFTLHRE